MGDRGLGARGSQGALSAFLHEAEETRLWGYDVGIANQVCSGQRLRRSDELTAASRPAVMTSAVVRPYILAETLALGQICKAHPAQLELHLRLEPADLIDVARLAFAPASARH
eukprot:scaffold61326_cov28-Tisochrysis_lutea.AAC.5